MENLLLIIIGILLLIIFALAVKVYFLRRAAQEIAEAFHDRLTADTNILIDSVVTSSPELKPERMDIVRALEESLLSFYAVMHEKGIPPEIELPEEPVYRELDVGAVNRIFSNIISNALKYSDGDLSVVMDENGCVTFSNTAHNLNAVTVGRLFDRFYTVEASRNSTGLGLSIAKVLIERMGGSIETSYNEGKLNISIRFLSD